LNIALKENELLANNPDNSSVASSTVVENYKAKIINLN
jgi:hypothetical protein